jgi:23S rRNA pseudouridine1911/1915/1917 synthase
MVLARNAKAAAELSRQIREGEFGKEYQIVVHGHPDSTQGTMEDLLLRNKEERKTYVVTEPGKDAQQAILHYQVMNSNDALTRVHVNLQTGRTHQIRVQFSSRGMPLVGDRKYSTLEDDCEIALWSYRLTFFHPYTGEQMEFTLEPPASYPWTAV